MTLIQQMTTDKFREIHRGDFYLQGILLLLMACCVSLACTGCTLWKQPGKPNWNNSAAAEQYERSMWQATRDKNWKDVEHHLAPMFTGVDPEGKKFDRDGWMTHWKSVQIRDLSLGEISIQPNGADMVISYELRLDADDPGHSLAGKTFRVVSVWQELKKGWVLTAQSLTPVAQ